jgi:type VI protein secretion system component Hcp
MPADAYIKFGESDGKGPLGTPLPAIEGDSTDAWHYWWCELRSCGFDLEATDWKAPGEENDSENDDTSKAKFKKVTLKKRVDWASTLLFRECCDQAMALSKSKAEQEQGWIDMVTVEICRQTGATVNLGGEMILEKIPFVTVKYHGVRVTRYAIDMNGPEPSESITFEFQKLEFEHVRTDPETGLKMSKDAVTRTSKLSNSATGQGGTPSAGGPAPAGVAMPAVVAASAGGPAAASSGANGSPVSAIPAIEVAVSANFPGLWQGTGFGVLPD